MTRTEDGLVPDHPRSTAVLVVRTWREEGSFRATLTWSADVASGQPWERGAASSPEEVLAIVERWLRAS